MAHDPQPWGLKLADDYVDAYSCTGGGSEVVLAPPEGPAVETSGEKWIVLIRKMGSGEEFPAPQPVGVTAAYYADWED